MFVFVSSTHTTNTESRDESTLFMKLSSGFKWQRESDAFIDVFPYICNWKISPMPIEWGEACRNFSFFSILAQRQILRYIIDPDRREATEHRTLNRCNDEQRVFFYIDRLLSHRMVINCVDIDIVVAHRLYCSAIIKYSLWAEWRVAMEIESCVCRFLHDDDTYRRSAKGSWMRLALGSMAVQDVGHEKLLPRHADRMSERNKYFTTCRQWCSAYGLIHHKFIHKHSTEQIA